MVQFLQFQPLSNFLMPNFVNIPLQFSLATKMISSSLWRCGWSVFLIAFVFLCLPVHSIIFDIDFPLSDKSSLTSITPIAAFGYLPGGHLQVDLTQSGLSIADGQTLTLMLLPERYWVEIKQARLIGKANNGGRQCLILPSTYSAQFEGPTLRFSTATDTLPLNGRYLLVAANCPSPATTIHLKGQMVMMNPDGQHLSLEDIPMLAVAVIFLVAYVFFAVFIAAYMLLFQRRFLLRLHWYILTCFAIKVVELALVYRVYAELSETGRLSAGVDSLERLWKVGSDTAFLLLLFLVASGWSITKEHLTGRERRLCICSFGLYVMFRTLYALCTVGSARLSPHNANHASSVSQSNSSSIPDDTSAICSAYVLAFSVLSFLVIFGVIVSLNATIERLRAWYLDAHAWRNLQRSLRHRLHKFRAFRWAFLAYLILPIVLVFVEFAVFTWRQDWLVQTLNECLIGFMLVFVAVYFAPDEKLFVPQRTVEETTAAPNVQAALLQMQQHQQQLQQQQQQQQQQTGETGAVSQ